MNEEPSYETLVAEVERLRRLLGADPSPSSEAYENVVQALVDERAVSTRLRDLLIEVLRHFPNPPSDTYGDYPAVRSEAVLITSLTRWRSALGGGS